MYINLMSGMLTGGLFIGYVGMWKIKHYELAKSDGVDANVIENAKRPIQNYFSRLQRIMTIMCVVFIIVHTFFSDAVPGAAPLTILNTTLAKIIGFILGILGLTICRIAQVAMGKSWRVGIDEHASPGLITHGIYQSIRNPTYSGLFLLSFGVLLINPTMWFSYWALALFIIMEFQVRCEEEYLEEKYGKTYLEYCQKTKRYVPFVY
jgi:protein-S-isoprenylcysteine O-methyltransferase Ste14